MLTEQRYQIILDLLKEKKSVTATELKEILDTSESTVRRDITALHKAGKLIKVFGGAVALEDGDTVSAYEPTVEQKSELYVEEKRKIAQYAAGLIEDEDFIYLCPHREVPVTEGSEVPVSVPGYFLIPRIRFFPLTPSFC